VLEPLKYVVGVPLAFFVSHLTAWFLADILTLLRYWLGNDAAFRISARIAFENASMSLALFTQPVVLRDYAIAKVPPFLAIALVVFLLRSSGKFQTKTGMILAGAALGFAIGAIFSVVFSVLSNQPCGFDMVCYWNGGRLHFLATPEIGSLVPRGIFGAVAGFLLCALVVFRHKV